MTIVLWILVAMSAAFMAYTGNIQTTTQWVGHRLAADDRMRISLAYKGTPLDFQSVVTAKVQNIRNFLHVGLLIAILVLGSVIAWYLGIVAVIVAYLGGTLFAQVLPRRFTHYLKWLLIDIQHRIADYRKAGDEMRAQSLEAVQVCVEELFVEAEEQKLDIRKLEIK